jgi:antitoxin ParD1/3/4
MATMNVSLPKKMKDWVEKRASEGQFANSSDYIRDLIREDEERQRVYDEIVQAGEEGLASGFSERTAREIGEAVFAELEAEEAAKKQKRRAG